MSSARMVVDSSDLMPDHKSAIQNNIIQPPEALTLQLAQIYQYVFEDESIAKRGCREVWSDLLRLGVTDSLMEEFDAFASQELRQTFERNNCESILINGYENNKSFLEVAEALNLKCPDALELFVFQCFVSADKDSFAIAKVAGGTGNFRAITSTAKQASRNEWKERETLSKDLSSGAVAPEAPASVLEKPSHELNHSGAQLFTERASKDDVSIANRRFEISIGNTDMSASYSDTIHTGILSVGENQIHQIADSGFIATLEEIRVLEREDDDKINEEYKSMRKAYETGVEWCTELKQIDNQLQQDVQKVTKEIGLDVQRHSRIARLLVEGTELLGLWSEDTSRAARYFDYSKRLYKCSKDLTDQLQDHHVFAVGEDVNATMKEIGKAETAWDDTVKEWLSAIRNGNLDARAKENIFHDNKNNVITDVRNKAFNAQNLLVTAIENVKENIKRFEEFKAPYQEIKTTIDNVEQFEDWVDRVNYVLDSNPEYLTSIEQLVGRGSINLTIIRDGVRNILKEVDEEADSFVVRFKLAWRNSWLYKLLYS